jgi:glycosyltransferase involved in cell wall biosynthesis
MIANTGALPEVAGDAALQVSPSDVGQWAAAFQKLNESPDLRDELRHRGTARVSLFRWDKTAQQTLEAIHQAVRAPV